MQIRQATALLLLGACGTAATGARADEALDRHRRAWTDAGIASYVYAYQKFCECHRDVPPQTFVEVAGGDVVDVHHLHADSARRVPAREGSLDLYWTIPGLFDLIAAADERDVTYRVEYEPSLGYPVRIYIDYDPAAVGEEIDIRLTAFEPQD